MVQFVQRASLDRKTVCGNKPVDDAVAGCRPSGGRSSRRANAVLSLNDVPVAVVRVSFDLRYPSRSEQTAEPVPEEDNQKHDEDQEEPDERERNGDGGHAPAAIFIPSRKPDRHEAVSFQVHLCDATVRLSLRDSREHTCSRLWRRWDQAFTPACGSMPLPDPPPLPRQGGAGCSSRARRCGR